MDCRQTEPRANFLHHILDLDLVNICSHTLIIDSQVKIDWYEVDDKNLGNQWAKHVFVNLYQILKKLKAFQFSVIPHI